LFRKRKKKKKTPFQMYSDAASRFSASSERKYKVIRINIHEGFRPRKPQDMDDDLVRAVRAVTAEAAALLLREQEEKHVSSVEEKKRKLTDEKGPAQKRQRLVGQRSPYVPLRATGTEPPGDLPPFEAKDVAFRLWTAEFLHPFAFVQVPIVRAEHLPVPSRYTTPLEVANYLSEWVSQTMIHHGVITATELAACSFNPTKSSLKPSDSNSRLAEYDGALSTLKALAAVPGDIQKLDDSCFNEEGSVKVPGVPQRFIDASIELSSLVDAAQNEASKLQYTLAIKEATARALDECVNTCTSWRIQAIQKVKELMQSWPQKPATKPMETEPQELETKSKDLGVSEDVSNPFRVMVQYYLDQGFDEPTAVAKAEEEYSETPEEDAKTLPTNPAGAGAGAGAMDAEDSGTEADEPLEPEQWVPDDEKTQLHRMEITKYRKAITDLAREEASNRALASFLRADITQAQATGAGLLADANGASKDATHTEHQTSSRLERELEYARGKLRSDEVAQFSWLNAKNPMAELSFPFFVHQESEITYTREYLERQWQSETPQPDFSPLWTANNWKIYESLQELVLDLYMAVVGRPMDTTLESSHKFCYRTLDNIVMDMKGKFIPRLTQEQRARLGVGRADPLMRDDELARIEMRALLDTDDPVIKPLYHNVRTILAEKILFTPNYDANMLSRFLSAYLEEASRLSMQYETVVYRCALCGKAVWAFWDLVMQPGVAPLCGWSVCQELGPDTAGLCSLVESKQIRQPDLASGTWEMVSLGSLSGDKGVVKILGHPDPLKDPIVKLFESELQLTDDQRLLLVINSLYTGAEVGANFFAGKQNEGKFSGGAASEIGSWLTSETLTSKMVEAASLKEALSTASFGTFSRGNLSPFARLMYQELVVGALAGLLSQARQEMAPSFLSLVPRLARVKTEDVRPEKMPILRTVDWGRICTTVRYVAEQVSSNPAIKKLMTDVEQGLHAPQMDPLTEQDLQDLKESIYQLETLFPDSLEVQRTALRGLDQVRKAASDAIKVFEVLAENLATVMTESLNPEVVGARGTSTVRSQLTRLVLGLDNGEDNTVDAVAMARKHRSFVVLQDRFGDEQLIHPRGRLRFLLEAVKLPMTFEQHSRYFEEGNPVLGDKDYSHHSQDQRWKLFKVQGLSERLIWHSICGTLPGEKEDASEEDESSSEEEEEEERDEDEDEMETDEVATELKLLPVNEYFDDAFQFLDSVYPVWVTANTVRNLWSTMLTERHLQEVEGTDRSERHLIDLGATGASVDEEVKLPSILSANHTFQIKYYKTWAFRSVSDKLDAQEMYDTMQKFGGVYTAYAKVPDPAAWRALVNADRGANLTEAIKSFNKQMIPVMKRLNEASVTSTDEWFKEEPLVKEALRIIESEATYDQDTRDVVDRAVNINLCYMYLSNVSNLVNELDTADLRVHETELRQIVDSMAVRYMDLEIKQHELNEMLKESQRQTQARKALEADIQVLKTELNDLEEAADLLVRTVLDFYAKHKSVHNRFVFVSEAISDILLGEHLVDVKFLKTMLSRLLAVSRKLYIYVNTSVLMRSKRKEWSNLVMYSADNKTHAMNRLLLEAHGVRFSIISSVCIEYILQYPNGMSEEERLAKPEVADKMRNIFRELQHNYLREELDPKLKASMKHMLDVQQRIMLTQYRSYESTVRGYYKWNETMETMDKALLAHGNYAKALEQLDEWRPRFNWSTYMLIAESEELSHQIRHLRDPETTVGWTSEKWYQLLDTEAYTHWAKPVIQVAEPAAVVALLSENVNRLGRPPIQFAVHQPTPRASYTKVKQVASTHAELKAAVTSVEMELETDRLKQMALKVLLDSLDSIEKRAQVAMLLDRYDDGGNKWKHLFNELEEMVEPNTLNVDEKKLEALVSGHKATKAVSESVRTTFRSLVFDVIEAVDSDDREDEVLGVWNLTVEDFAKSTNFRDPNMSGASNPHLSMAKRIAQLMRLRRRRAAANLKRIKPNLNHQMLTSVIRSRLTGSFSELLVMKLKTVLRFGSVKNRKMKPKLGSLAMASLIKLAPLIQYARTLSYIRETDEYKDIDLGDLSPMQIVFMLMDGSGVKLSELPSDYPFTNRYLAATLKPPLTLATFLREDLTNAATHLMQDLGFWSGIPLDGDEDSKDQVISKVGKFIMDTFDKAVARVHGLPLSRPVKERLGLLVTHRFALAINNTARVNLAKEFLEKLWNVAREDAFLNFSERYMFTPSEADTQALMAEYNAEVKRMIEATVMATMYALQTSREPVNEPVSSLPPRRDEYSSDDSSDEDYPAETLNRLVRKKQPKRVVGNPLAFKQPLATALDAMKLAEEEELLAEVPELKALRDMQLETPEDEQQPPSRAVIDLTDEPPAREVVDLVDEDEDEDPKPMTSGKLASLLKTRFQSASLY